MAQGDDVRHDAGSVADSWIRVLEGGGYERSVDTRRDLRRLRRLSRTLRTVLRRTELADGARVLEAGCGGGNQLVPLALNGYECTGVDCSSAVLARCRDLLCGVSALDSSHPPVDLVCADFLDFDTPVRFDMVCNFGVVEHFLDDDERSRFLKKCFDLTVPGGWVVSVVPSGSHPLRQRARQEGLGGYNIPEVDYSAESMHDELMEAGASSVAVIPNNLLGYRKFEQNLPHARHAFNSALHLVAQTVPRLPVPVINRHATSFIGIGQARTEP